MAAHTDRQFERRLSALVNARERRVLLEGLKGVEKESLRVRPDGHLATTPHPYELGSALTNEHITTDFSESLIDLVTPDKPTQYWLGLTNFYVITRYNRSSFYAMSVLELAEAIRAQRDGR